MAPVPIPLGLQAYSRPSGFEPDVRLVNMYIEEDTSGASPDKVFRLQRPGLTPYATLPNTPIRGMYQHDGVAGGLPLVVAGGQLFTIDGATVNLIGPIADDDGETVAFAANAFGTAIASSGAFYFYDGSALGRIDMPDEVQIIDVECLDSYFILPLSNGTFYWLVPGASSVDALDFADAESSPDGLVGVKRLNDELFMFGTSTIEIWQTTGDFNLPFQRAPGRLFDRGCMARDAIRNFDNSIAWVGDDGKVYRISAVPERISTDSIEEKIHARTDDVSAFTFSIEGHLFYVLKIPGQGSFAYDAATKVWSEFATYGASTWAPWCSATLSDETVLVGDTTTGSVWKLDKTQSNDAGLTMQRLATGSLPFNGRPYRMDNLTLLVGTQANANFLVRWWDAQDAPSPYRTLAAVAPVDNPSCFRLGAADQPFRVFEVSCLDNTKIRISGAILNGAWR